MKGAEHLVSLELDGAPFDLRNVWPQPKGEARVKDRVEDALHAAVCYRRGFHGLHLGLAQAQAAISRDWTATPVGVPNR